ncbi:MAG TPA: hypothetical protein VLA90_06275 [Actinomycetota bacterium]|nr:hypothetical protein [Actinomycetota bacterium]
MSDVAVVWLVVAVVSTAAVAAVLVGLVRHVFVLVRALGRFRDEVSPLAEDIAALGRRTGGRSGRAPGSPFGRPRS